MGAQLSTTTVFTDRISADAMMLISGLFPAFEKSSAFNVNPPSFLLSILRASSILDRAAEFMRNESIEEVISKASLYSKVCTFVIVLSTHHAMVTTVLSLRLGKAGKNLLHPSLANGKVMDTNDSRTSIAGCFANIGTQSQSILENTVANTAEFSSNEGRLTFEFCQMLSNLLQTVNAVAECVKANTQEFVKPGEDPWHREHCVSAVDDNDMFSSHCFSREAQMWMIPAIGRLDVMKAIIIGPEGTPYADGVFEFDIFCPKEYPKAPPRVNIKTTGRGTMRFNPNLYANGKVCLSLLNTLSGERWQPNKSTLLQVLVSIQGMVFYPEPYFNEPTRFYWASLQATSAGYNRRIQNATVLWGIMSAIGSCPLMWQPIYEQHFKANAERILRTAGEWSADPRKSKRNHLTIVVDGGTRTPVRESMSALRGALGAVDPERVTSAQDTEQYNAIIQRGSNALTDLQNVNKAF
ncbi:hypothetical protein K402DRAFT_402863 [Aulographum hederae CBS 113979]|uniref:UBC core domain-containing protein n=1 Tax=Aulographum hederae CBS 113979 TaxID=1176131 RepID=A0A6G1H4K7_9PEZI|nr:hypothetical protein K402DRAFT_402863 [Aulographum hederae CBS 113979]